MKPKSFLRKVGFGLRPDEKIPEDPLNWAKSQMNSVPNLIWPGKIYSEQEMLDIRVDFTTQEDKIQKTEKNPATAKVKKNKLYRGSGRRYFESYELAIRHHQAVYGKQPVFERFWHFWGNHFTIIDKNKLATFNTGAMQREQLRTLMTGRFADMVYDMTLTWPMIKSLDNFKSRGPNSQFNVNRRRKNKPEKGLNENHGRELLELHTISPNAGYTQDDVINTANIMTGWGFIGGRKGVEAKKIGYQGSLHEPGIHTVLGKKYKTSGFSAKTKGKKQFDDVIGTLRKHMGKTFNNTIIASLTEFGRTMSQNGGSGTEHGYGTAILMAGGLLPKSRVISDWPGLEQKNLFEGRDLNSSIDARAVYASILARVLKSDHQKIVKDAFFNSDLPDMTKRIFL